MERFTNISGATKVIQYEDASVSLINGASVLVESSVALDALVTEGILSKEGNVQTITIDVTADVSDPPLTVLTATFPFRIIDVCVECTVTEGGGGLRVQKNGFDLVTEYITCDTNKAVVRASPLYDAFSTISVGDVLDIQSATADTRGRVIMKIVKITD